MKALFKHFTFVLSLVALLLIFSVSLAAAQRGNGNHDPPPDPGQQHSQNQGDSQNNQSQNQTGNQTQTQTQNGTQTQAQNQNGGHTQAQNQAGTQTQTRNQDGAQTQIQNQDGAQTQAQNQVQTRPSECPNCPMAIVELPAEVIGAMNAGLASEYAAYDLYDGIMAQLGEILPFSNIRRAEANHSWVWERMFARYGLDLPARSSRDVPTFATVAEACAYAAAFELEQSNLYAGLLPLVSDYANLTRLMTALQSVSLNQHLPALNQCAGQ